MKEIVVEQYIRDHLKNKGYVIAERKNKRGIDVDAMIDGKRIIVEVKGCGAHSTAMTNNFQAVLGQILRDMQDKNAEYYIAFPYMQPYMRLWESLPSLAKERTGINVIWVEESGKVIGI